MAVDNKLVTMLDLLSVTPMVDYITVNADTKYEMKVLWNPNMNGGEFEVVIKESGYIEYWEYKTARDVAHDIQPRYLRILDWIPEDWDDRGDIAHEIDENIVACEWHQITDDMICEMARHLGYCD